MKKFIYNPNQFVRISQLLGLQVAPLVNYLFNNGTEIEGKIYWHGKQTDLASALGMTVPTLRILMIKTYFFIDFKYGQVILDPKILSLTLDALEKEKDNEIK